MCVYIHVYIHIYVYVYFILSLLFLERTMTNKALNSYSLFLHFAWFLLSLQLFFFKSGCKTVGYYIAFVLSYP